MSKRVCLGKIAGAHGIKGLVKILPYGEDPQLIETLGPVFTSADGAETLSVALKNKQGKFWLASLKDLSDRTEAEKLKGTELWIDKDKLPEITDPDSFYIEDLIGLDVLNDKNEKIGNIVAIENYGAGDLLEIRLKSGKDFLIPYTNHYVPEINIEKSFIVLSDYEALKDL